MQRTHDPNIIGHFLHRYPFHIDALLQMSEVFQHHGQMDHAADCIKRCMYVLELAWADQFDVAKGSSRMDINAEHNDGFFKALFLLTKQVGRRGCMRSAFETAKLLLSMDPQGDPMNVLLAIDYYALTSRQCQFLIDLCASKLEAVDRFRAAESSTKKSVVKHGTETAGDEQTISALPNMQFSLALAQYVALYTVCHHPLLCAHAFIIHCVRFRVVSSWGMPTKQKNFWQRRCCGSLLF